MLSKEQRDNITSEDCHMKTVIAHLRYRLRREISMYSWMKNEAKRRGDLPAASGFDDRQTALEWAWEEAVYCERSMETMGQQS